MFFMSWNMTTCMLKEKKNKAVLQQDRQCDLKVSL